MVEKLTMDILELSTVGAGSPLSLAGGLDCTVVRGRQAALRPSYTPRLLSEPPSARLLQLALLLQRYVLSSICPCQSWWITGRPIYIEGRPESVSIQQGLLASWAPLQNPSELILSKDWRHQNAEWSCHVAAVHGRQGADGKSPNERHWDSDSRFIIPSTSETHPCNPWGRFQPVSV